MLRVQWQTIEAYCSNFIVVSTETSTVVKTLSDEGILRLHYSSNYTTLYIHVVAYLNTLQ